MAGNSRNEEYTTRGNDVILDIYIRNSLGVLVDADSPPTYTITDPSSTILATGSGTKISTGYYQATYSVVNTATISNLYVITWIAYVNSQLVPDTWEYWRVITSVEDEIGDVIVSNTDLNLIKAALAYPSADNLLLDDDAIKTYCIYPALIEYFTKFPIKIEYEETISSNAPITVDYPDELTFGAVDARIVDKFNTTTSSSSSFWELVQFQQYGMGYYKGSYGKCGYNPNGLQQANFTAYQARQAQTKYHQIIRIRVDEANRQIAAFSNYSGTLYVVWAKYSLNFNNIKFQQKMNAVKLAQSYLLRHLADTASIVNDTTLDVNVNTDELKTKADELRDQVHDLWEQYTDVVLIKL